MGLEESCPARAGDAAVNHSHEQPALLNAQVDLEASPHSAPVLAVGSSERLALGDIRSVRHAHLDQGC